MSYRDPDYLMDASTILQVLKGGPLTEEQLAERLPDIDMAAMVLSGRHNGWLKRFVNWNDPNRVLWQINRCMIQHNWRNRLIASAVPRDVKGRIPRTRRGLSAPSVFVPHYGIVRENYVFEEEGCLETDEDRVVLKTEFTDGSLERPPFPPIVPANIVVSVNPAVEP
jgi:hypothetical protein